MKKTVKKMMQLCFMSISAVIFLSSCVSEPQTRKEVFANQVKDWITVLRGSQVLPLFPLSDDVVPGDVLLVTTPIENQIDEFEKDGYVPFDQVYTRLAYSPLLKDEIEIHYSEVYGNKESRKHPAAAFPPINVSIDNSTGSGIMLPIAGVQAALSAIAKQDQRVSVSLTDAVTYGLPVEILYKLVQRWALWNRGLLKHYAPIIVKGDNETTTSYNYLRVISRVYQIKSATVEIASSGEINVEASAENNDLSNEYSLLNNPERAAVSAVQAWNEAIGDHHQLLQQIKNVEEKISQLSEEAEGQSKEENSELLRIQEQLQLLNDQKELYQNKTDQAKKAAFATVNALLAYNDEETLSQDDTTTEDDAIIHQMRIHLFLSELLQSSSQLKISAIVKHRHSTSITLDLSETPVNVGYIGFDVPILADGNIGFPISTIDQLSNRNLSSLPVISQSNDYSNPLTGSSIPSVFEDIYWKLVDLKESNPYAAEQLKKLDQYFAGYYEEAQQLVDAEKTASEESVHNDINTYLNTAPDGQTRAFLRLFKAVFSNESKKFELGLNSYTELFTFMESSTNLFKDALELLL